MVFHVHRSNRTERLVGALAEIVARPQADPLVAEWIVVSSPGMERWLSMQLARRVGIWANPRFPFPRKLIDGMLQAALEPEPAALTGFEPTCLLFSIASLLAELWDDERFVEVRRYCDAQAGANRRLALAARLAELFDQYLTYRPDLVLEWAKGGEQDFQAPLMRALIERHGPRHLAARAWSACRVLQARTPGEPLAGIPQRVHLFGISSMPPLYLDLLSALGHCHDVHLYVLSPSREYFADLSPKRRRGPTRAALQLSFGEPDFTQEGHALLGSLGRHAREFQALLEGHVQYAEDDVELFEDPGHDTLLHALQADLLALRRRGEGYAPRYPLTAQDDSIAIHACHSPMRELEVLHDQLCRLISECAVEPHEIIVMTPNISEYAKVIDAVFAQPRAQRPQIPFRVADRGVAQTEPLLLGLFALLDVLQGRFGANQVLDLLGFDLIREHFEIGADQVDELRSWIEQSEIRWGVDAAHRAQQAQPACIDNTWRFGLDRLLLGYATGLPPDQLFRGCSPLPIASGQGPLLGRFLELCQTLFELHECFSTDATVAEWTARLLRLVDSTLGAQSVVAERKQLLVALRELSEHAERASFHEAFDLAALGSLLERVLSARQPAQGFLASGVTFCQLLPMRSIPFKVLCLIGLNDGVFPQSDTPLAFDCIASQRRPGDRCRRDDDRQLFLEALLSARERLLITYVGQSQRKNQALAPSVLVQELIDHLSQSCELPGQAPELSDLERAEALQGRLVLRHPLSGTSPRYFGADADRRLFSYANSSCSAARASLRRAAAPVPFGVFTSSSPERPAELSLRELERCLMHPSRSYCQRRLNLVLGDDLSALPEREPFALDALQRWQIATEWLQHALLGQPQASRFEVQRARGRLPLFASGALAYAELQRAVEQILEVFAGHTGGAPPRSVEVDLELDGVRLRGSLGDIYPSAHVRVQFSQLGGRHELRQFVRYVVLRCVAQQQPELQLPRRSVLVARQGALCYELPGAQSMDVLRELLALYCEASAAPLPLFAYASRAYARTQLERADSQLALESARKAFGDSRSSPGKADMPDAYVEQLFGGFEQMLAHAGARFEHSALRLFGPMLAAQQDL